MWTEKTFAPWYKHPLTTGPCVEGDISRMPGRWMESFKSQLERWRNNHEQIRRTALEQGQSHGMLPGQTWLFAGPGWMREDGSRKERLMMACLPPRVLIHEGLCLLLCSSDSMQKEPGPIMPEEVVTVWGAPRLLSVEEIEALAWGAWEEREVFVGQVWHSPYERRKPTNWIERPTGLDIIPCYKDSAPESRS